MIIYGTKATHLLTASLPNTCPHCSSTHTITMGVFQKYGHLYGIPFIPLGKVVATECAHCRQVLKEAEIPATWAMDAQELKTHAKTPVWTFAGFGVVAVLFAAGAWMSKENDAKNAQWIVAPQKGDVYEVKTDDGQYTLYKIHAVTADSVAILMNQYEATRSKGLRKIKSKGDEAYIPTPIMVAKARLKTMMDEGAIMDIERE